MKIDLTPKTKYNKIWLATYVASIFAGVYLYSWQAVLGSYLAFVFIFTFGIGFGIHRVIIHRAVEVPQWVKRASALVGTLTNTGSPITWGTSHYLHHVHSDTENDPHTPVVHGAKILFGFYNTEAILANSRSVFAAIRHIARDKFVASLHRYYYAYVFGYLALTLLFGLKGLILAGLIPTGLAHIAISVLNYVGHGKAGYRNFDTREQSRNVWWIFPLLLGENWHNNHHKKPNAMTTKVRWFEFDPSAFWCVIFSNDNHTKWKVKFKIFKQRFKRKSKDYMYE